MEKVEKAMAPYSSTLAWRIPWMEEPGALQSMGSRRVRHDWTTSLLLFTFMHRRRKWQPTPVFLLGESQGWWSLVGYCLWGRTESDTTELLLLHLILTREEGAEIWKTAQFTWVIQAKVSSPTLLCHLHETKFILHWSVGGSSWGWWSQLQIIK